jgi:predicted secreted protein
MRASLFFGLIGLLFSTGCANYQLGTGGKVMVFNGYVGFAGAPDLHGVMNDGRALFSKKEVKVTLGGCGG